MQGCFEILHKDLAGRIGRLHTPHGTVETPALMPVVNPHVLLLSPQELVDLGADMIITNSYIIHQDPILRETALERGVHGLLGFDGPVMTDSGAFQLSVYGNVDVEPLEILEFQQEIRSDISVPLDIPTAPDASREQAGRELAETERRLREAVAHRREDLLIAGPVQGGIYPDLRESAARRLRGMGFDVYPIGAVVPLMESYRFTELVDVVVASKIGLGPGVPVHLFGAGHPMVFALAAALGCDLFDSAAYALYARDGRYLTPTGTYRLSELKYLPCSCDVCREHTPASLNDDPKRVELLARHNLLASFQELRAVRQSIHEGSLWEHLERRCRSHPRMYQAFKHLSRYAEYLERLDRVSKTTLFYLSTESARRPEVIRYRNRICRLELRGKVLVTDRHPEEEDRTRYDHILGFLPPFGPYPLGLEEMYPLNAELPDEMDDSAVKEALDTLRSLIRENPGAEFHVEISCLEGCRDAVL
ncbi:MAG: tRNA guanosine(15) transglycosylase TgtA [Methanothrix sp.]|jgi:7-cyano-7-deazaguanine tRNA-ribosyltransferase|uniref:tRNA guanosine(15) transglycosylase TgtA n=1 Tax=Methanothrix sp. TaxID=90426 RepID=UPI00247C7965|nr:tRNA guanosine(15) transglycosylase TgtA [Methanothrix sp.]